MKLLNNRYGNPHYFLASYKKEAKALPSVNPGDASGFRTFYGFVLKYNTFSKNTAWYALETPHSAFLFRSCQVTLGIDGTKKYRWLEENLEENHVYQILPLLYMKSMTLFCLTMLYWSMLRLLIKKNYNKKKFGNVFMKWGEVVKCCLCEGYDDLDDCNSFLQFDLEERRKWLFHNNLCYVFLSVISVNHNARNCKHRKECKVCKKRHPASLHGYKAEKSKVKQPGDNSSEESKVNVNCATANTKSDVSSMCLVPLLVRHKLSNCIVETFVLPNNCSQATFTRNKFLDLAGYF